MYHIKISYDVSRASTDLNYSPNQGSQKNVKTSLYSKCMSFTVYIDCVQYIHMSIPKVSKNH